MQMFKREDDWCTKMSNSTTYGLIIYAQTETCKSHDMAWQNMNINL